MSAPIQPYTLSPYQAGLRVAFDGQENVIVSPGPRRAKVAIYGAGGVSRHDVPNDDQSFEVWAINNFWNAARDSEGRLRADVWWEQHAIFPDASGPEAGVAIQDRWDMEWIRTCPVPLYTTEPFPENPNAVVWPVDERVRQSRGRKYFACTFAMQIAEAIVVGFDEIHVFGLALLRGTQREATVEASCVAYWLGLAEGRGVKVVVPKHELLLSHPYVYGHQYWKERRWVEGYLARWDERPVAV